MQEDNVEREWHESERSEESSEAELNPSIDQATQTETIESKPKRSKKKIFAIASVSLVLICGVSIFVYFSTSMAASNTEAQETNLSELRKVFDESLGELELKVLNIKEQEVAQNNQKIKNLQSQLELYKKQLSQLEVTSSNQTKIITSLASTEKFNQQLVDLLSKENDKNKVEIGNMRAVLESLNKKVNSKVGKGNGNAAKKQEAIITLETVSGFTLFSIDLWGDEKIAVFTKDNKIEKVKVGEKIEGYLVTGVFLNRGFVSLYKNNRKYAIKVK